MFKKIKDALFNQDDSYAQLAHSKLKTAIEREQKAEREATIRKLKKDRDLAINVHRYSVQIGEGASACMFLADYVEYENGVAKFQAIDYCSSDDLEELLHAPAIIWTEPVGFMAVSHFVVRENPDYEAPESAPTVRKRRSPKRTQKGAK